MPLFQSESKCETILMKMTLICMKMKLHGFALTLVLKQRHKRNSVGNGLTRLHFAADFLQKNKKINPRIILQMRRSLTKVFSEAVRNTRSMRFKSDKTLLF